MRILVSGDLHYQPATRPAYVAFAAWVRDQAPDCFILAGDVGHPLRLFRRGLDLFAQLDCPRLFIAGNHDLYRGEHDSRTLWERVLPEHVQQGDNLSRIAARCGTTTQRLVYLNGLTHPSLIFPGQVLRMY